MSIEPDARELVASSPPLGVWTSPGYPLRLRTSFKGLSQRYSITWAVQGVALHLLNKSPMRRGLSVFSRGSTLILPDPSPSMIAVRASTNFQHPRLSGVSRDNSDIAGGCSRQP